MLDALAIERVKGIFRGEQLGFSYNRSSDSAAIENIDQPEQSQLQLIHSSPIDRTKIDKDLKACLQT